MGAETAVSNMSSATAASAGGGLGYIAGNAAKTSNTMAQSKVSGLGKALLAVGGIAALMQVLGGVSANKAAKAEAQAQEDQIQYVQEDTSNEARQKAREVTKFREEQAVAYNKSGVTLAGSPLLVLDETRRLGQEEIDAIQRRGQNMQELYKQKAKQTKSAGRSALLGSLAGAALGGASLFLLGKKIGLFGNTSSPANPPANKPGSGSPPGAPQPIGDIIR